jgi:hypothetical protein
MAELKQGDGRELQEHPLLKRLYETNAMANVTSLKGYVGRAPSDNHIRLFADLGDLSDSVDISKADIVHFAEAPDVVLPLGGTIIWLKRDAQVIINKVETTPAAAKTTLEGVEVNRGRLRIFVRGGLRSSVCQSRCQVCTSRCKVCQSRCSATVGLPAGFAFPQTRER